MVIDEYDAPVMASYSAPNGGYYEEALAVAGRRNNVLHHLHHVPGHDVPRRNDWAETGESDVANPASVSDLAGTIAPMLKDTSADALSNRACDASMSDSDLNALAHDFGISDCTMVNRMITVQYQADQVKDGIETMRTTNARARLSSLTSRARLAYERSAGKADEGLRAVLQTSIDTAQQMLDTLR